MKTFRGVGVGILFAVLLFGGGAGGVEAASTTIVIQEGSDPSKDKRGELSRTTFVEGNEIYMQLYSSITVGDLTNMQKDLSILYARRDANPERIKINLFISSPGGDAFSGLALADQIKRAQRLGFTVTASASGLVASAAVPIFAVADTRIAAPGTIFMVHEASLWKWPGRETASDIRSQNRLMGLLQERYIAVLADRSNLSVEEWIERERTTTWFSAKQAKEWGLVDLIQ
ncbi:hypothetical protein LCGC14_0614140 [marine sediment metagenome]|uniref:ATP-dependent Clp protease proteolytic subunit n=1 Tax=marine sediment metagenome TaxID=412755 RepID=A0A0F9UFE4_9ZZZZ